jgi:signal transduction histidine kinase
MALSITQRLTILVGLLAGLILGLAGAVLYLSVARGTEAKGRDEANATALLAARTILRQWDEDILVDFARDDVRFDKLRMPIDHWAVIGVHGHVEAAAGIFTQDPSTALEAAASPQRAPHDETLMLASAPLISKEHLEWDEIPRPVRSVAEANAEAGLFLTAKTEVSGDLNVFVVQWLYPDHLLEVGVTDQGELFEIEPEPLPDRLPDGMVVATASGEEIGASKIVGWQAYEGELIAIVEGRLENGQAVRVAVNRLGEQYAVTLDGTITGRLEESRLRVVVAYDMSPDIAGARFFGRAAAAGGTVIWILIMVITWQVTKHALRPVNEMVQQAERIDLSQLQERLPVGSANDELSQIARTVNTMLDRIQDGYQREQQFTGDASHEMRNPLAKMIAEIDLARSRPRDNRHYEATLDQVKGYAHGMQQLVESLLLLARLDGGHQKLQREPFDVTDLAMEMVRALPADMARRVRLELGDSTEPMQAVGHRYLIGALLGNLLNNALRYSPPDSPVRLRVSPNGRKINVDVEDEGPGIPQEEVSLVFNRFHRLEKSRSRQTGGIGLGLSIVKAIADVHGIKVELGTSAAGGTLVTFALASLNGHAQGI